MFSFDTTTWTNENNFLIVYILEVGNLPTLFFVKKLTWPVWTKLFIRSFLRKKSQMPDSTHWENKILLFVMYKKFIFSIDFRRFSLFLFSRTQYTKMYKMWILIDLDALNTNIYMHIFLHLTKNDPWNYGQNLLKLKRTHFVKIMTA